MTKQTAVTKQTATRYRKASKKYERGMLDELCALNGWTRRPAAGGSRPTVII